MKKNNMKMESENIPGDGTHAGDLEVVSEHNKDCWSSSFFLLYNNHEVNKGWRMRGVHGGIGEITK